MRSGRYEIHYSYLRSNPKDVHIMLPFRNIPSDVTLLLHEILQVFSCPNLISNSESLSGWIVTFFLLNQEKGSFISTPLHHIVCGLYNLLPKRIPPITL